MTSSTSFQYTLVLRKSGVAIFTDMKIVTYFSKTMFKDSRKEVNQNAFYTHIPWYSKICWFLVKNCWCQQKSRGVSHVIYFGYFLGKVYQVHHCRICMTDFWEGLAYPPPPPRHPWAVPKKAILNRLMFLLSPAGPCTTLLITSLLKVQKYNLVRSSRLQIFFKMMFLKTFQSS